MQTQMLSATSQQEMIFVKYFTPAYFPLSRHLPNILPAWFYKSAACYAYMTNIIYANMHI